VPELRNNYSSRSSILQRRLHLAGFLRLEIPMGRSRATNYTFPKVEPKNGVAPKLKRDRASKLAKILVREADSSQFTVTESALCALDDLAQALMAHGCQVKIQDDGSLLVFKSLSAS
jgi:hypothetical protein